MGKDKPQNVKVRKAVGSEGVNSKPESSVAKAIAFVKCIAQVLALQCQHGASGSHQVWEAAYKIGRSPGHSVALGEKQHLGWPLAWNWEAAEVVGAQVAWDAQGSSRELSSSTTKSSGWECWCDLRGGRRNKHKLPVSTISWWSGREPKHGWLRACGRERGPAGLWAVVSVSLWLGRLWKAGNWFQQLPAALRTAAQTSGALWQIEADCWWRSIDFPFLNRGIISQEKHLLITRRKKKKKKGKKEKDLSVWILQQLPFFSMCIQYYIYCLGGEKVSRESLPAVPPSVMRV